MDDRLRQLIALGRDHYNAGEYEKAEQYLSQVVKDNRGYADIFNMLGVIFHDQGRFAEAEDAFENALRINPSYTEAALNLSVTYNDRGKYHKAREVYASAMSHSYQTPSSMDPFARGKIANMHADLGVAYADMGLHMDAVRELKRALELCPNFIDIRTRLGNVYRDMGDPEAALGEYTQVKTTKPEYLPARLALGVTLYSLGRREDAIAEWEAILEHEPSDRRAHAYLRMVRNPGRPAAPAPRPEEAPFPERDD
ncbi:MAG TPA: tetratricopeptide repeat protein [Kofleriaceae bacterium]|nr:tetratricopeptide repeat protein [Kofleriaceae bacterium]